MKSWPSLLILWAIILAGCSVGPSAPKGEATLQSRGSEALTNEGDPLVGAGSAVRKVPLEFAKGYTKGVSDQIKRTYWAQQEAQKPKTDATKGRVRYFNATIPERQDLGGVIRVQREVLIPIVE